VYEGEDVDASESSSRRKGGSTKPKLSKYWSNLKGGPQKEKEQIFSSEPWSEENPYIVEPFVNPLTVIQSVSSLLSKIPPAPIPVQHGSGILRVFEEYRRVREEKERSESLFKDLLYDYRNAEDRWYGQEEQYLEEIRRLELIIARGESGMSGLMKARHGSLIDKRRSSKKRIALEPDQSAVKALPKDKLDKEIQARSHQGCKPSIL
jgi:hypothetical protein